MEISKKEFEIIFKTLINKYFEDNPSMYLDEDFYWRIPVDDLYSLNKDPTNFTIGQLTDDAQELLKITEDKTRATTHDLYKLSSILRYMSKF